MRLLHILVYIVVLFFLVTIGISVIRANAATGTERISTQVTEDSPGWDCRTMGNKLCGPKEYGTPKFAFYSEVFNCFAEIDYTEPQLSWNARVSRCIPDGVAPR